jgi:hypothetical protein
MTQDDSVAPQVGNVEPKFDNFGPLSDPEVAVLGYASLAIDGPVNVVDLERVREGSGA